MPRRDKSLQVEGKKKEKDNLNYFSGTEISVTVWIYFLLKKDLNLEAFQGDQNSMLGKVL